MGGRADRGAPQRGHGGRVTRDALDQALLAAYRSGDGAEIARLYGAAGDAAADVDEACFFWTHAYVFALEAGIPEAEQYRASLKKEGREA